MPKKKNARRKEPEVVPEIKGPSKPTDPLRIAFRMAWHCLHYETAGIFAIYGAEGIGKTTILTLFKKKFLISSPDQPYLVIWAAATRHANLDKLQDNIAKQIAFAGDQWKSKSFEERAEDIYTVLSKTKFVFLLDDVWEKLDLAKIGVPFPRIPNGSRIIFTTRFKNVCDDMFTYWSFNVRPLSLKDGWEFFQANIGEETFDGNQSNIQLAQLVVRKCAGLPLALTTSAHALSRKRTPLAWYRAVEAINKSGSDLSGTEDELYSVLKLGYENLTSDTVRSCFLYCSLFPWNFKILKDDLIDYWICEGLLGAYDSRSSTQNAGYDIISALVEVCLLEEEENQHVKMHNLTREVALQIANERKKENERFLVQAADRLTDVPEVGGWNGIRRISLMENSISNLTEVPTAPNLSTLFLNHNPFNVISVEFFRSMEALTVLDLSNTSIEEVPQGISRLASLQYLNLSRTCIEQLPVELGKLVKLKYLNLEYNDLLRMIPRQMIASLKFLEVLRMFRCGFSVVEEENNILSDSNMVVEELQSLNHLYLLSITITSASALEKLRSCTRALSLECFWGSKEIDILSLADLEQLNTLEIHHTDHLQEFNVKFQDSQFLRERRFSSLREVNIEKCLRLRDLTWLILAPNLTVLRVSSCERMQEIISIGRFDEIDGEQLVNIFAKLQVLVLESLPNLQSIFVNALPFPLLNKIKVVDCPMLKKLPLNSSSAKGSAALILAEEHWWKNVEWEDNATKAAFQPRFVHLPD